MRSPWTPTVRWRTWPRGSSNGWDSRLRTTPGPFRGAQELHQVLAPDGGPRVGAVADRLLARGDEHVAPAAHARHEPLHEPELRRVHEVVGEVDREHGHADRLQPRRGVVVARRLEG